MPVTQSGIALSGFHVILGFVQGLWRFRPKASPYQEVSYREVSSHCKFVPLQFRTMEVSSHLYKVYIYKFSVAFMAL